MLVKLRLLWNSNGCEAGKSDACWDLNLGRFGQRGLDLELSGFSYVIALKDLK